MKRFIALAAVLGSLTLSAAEKELEVLKSTAKELDNLVSQKNVAYKEVVRPNFPTTKYKVPPVSLNQVAPAVSNRLKLNQSQVIELLTDDQTKLSDLVMARLLQESGGKAWNQLLSEKNSDELLLLVEERQLTTRVKSMLDELYTEVSFAVLDAMDRSTASGAAPGGTKGQDKHSDKKK